MKYEKVEEFIKSLEDAGLVKPGSHKMQVVIDNVKNIVSMTDEEHEAFQKKTPHKGVLMFFSEFQSWKETNL